METFTSENGLYPTAVGCISFSKFPFSIPDAQVLPEHNTLVDDHGSMLLSYKDSCSADSLNKASTIYLSIYIPKKMWIKVMQSDIKLYSMPENQQEIIRKRK